MTSRKWEETFQDSLMYQMGKAMDESSKGHVWKRDDMVYPDGYVPPDIFALSEGYHNGPECASCGYSYCQHCTSRITKCPSPKEGLLDALVEVVLVKRDPGHVRGEGGKK